MKSMPLVGVLRVLLFITLESTHDGSTEVNASSFDFFSFICLGEHYFPLCIRMFATEMPTVVAAEGYGGRV